MIRNLVPQFKKARLFCIFLLLPTLLFSQTKIALVLGVNEYDLLSPLKAAVNDSEKIASYYGGLGFKVVLQNDRQACLTSSGPSRTSPTLPATRAFPSWCSSSRAMAFRSRVRIFSASPRPSYRIGPAC